MLHEAPWEFFGNQPLFVHMVVTVHGFGSMQFQCGQSVSVPRASIGVLKQPLQMSMLRHTIRRGAPGAAWGSVRSVHLVAGCQWSPHSI